MTILATGFLLVLNKLADMTAPAFRMFFWPHRLLVLAPGFVSSLHRHHAAQVLIALDDSLEYRCDGGTWQPAAGFVVAPNVPHAHRSAGAIAMLYVEAESSDWRASACCARAAGGVCNWSPDTSVLTAASLAGGEGDAAMAGKFCAAVLGERAPTWTTLDPRIASAQEYIAAHLDRPMRLAEIARAVHLSPGRLAHLFQRSAGVPVRRYVLWRRLRVAVEAALQGSSLTDAAHESGFSDAAHLSRTFRAMFGIAPSAFTQNTTVVVLPAA